MRLGIDLGGSKIEVVVLDVDGEIVFQKRMVTPKNDYRETLMAVVGLVREAEDWAGTTLPVGIGMPGSVSKVTGRIKNANSTCLNGMSFREDIEKMLRRSVVVANDANCFALSEAMDGAGKDVATVFGVILGTGVGGGIVSDKKIIDGPNSIAGEWGHNPLCDPAGLVGDLPYCYCGRRGCVETFLSGPALSRQHEERAGSFVEASEIAALAEMGEAVAQKSLDLYATNLAKALAVVINILDPDLIVLGGGLSNCKQLYEQVPERLPEFVFSDRVDTPVVAPVFGDSSGVRGAAWLTG